MKRPLLLSSVVISAISLLLIKFSFTASVITLLVSAVVLILYFIKPLNLKKYIFIPAICISAIIITFSFNLYNKINIEPVLKYDNTENYIAGKIISTPKNKGKFTYFTIKTDKIGNENQRAKINVKLKSNQKVELYNYVSIDKASIYIPKTSNNDYDFSKASDSILLEATTKSINHLWECDKTIYFKILKLKEIVENRIDNFLNTNTGALLKGMLFGDKAHIDNETYSYFRNSGIAHILAVSGLHTTLWCSILLSIFKLFKISDKIGNIVCILFLCAFSVVSAFTPSVLRASLMMFIVLISTFFNRDSDSLNSLGFAVTILLLYNPYLILNVGFELSVMATAGALIGLNLEEAFIEKLKPIKEKHLKAIIKYIGVTVLISGFIAIFTMPLSAYYFGVFSLVSPLSNLLCVKLCFYAMALGIISTILAPIDFLSPLCIVLFKITGFILDLIIKLAKTLASLKFCTIPIHKEFLIYACAIVLVILFVGFILYKLKSKIFLKASAILSVIVLFTVSLLPLYHPKYKNTVTIVSVGNNIEVIVRSGLNYGYITNSEVSCSSSCKYLPKATSETFKYYIPTQSNKKSINNIKEVQQMYSPKETYFKESTYNFLKANGTDLIGTAYILNQNKFVLSNEISFEIIDTYPAEYVIIRGRNKNILVHLNGEATLSDVVDINSFDVLVFNSVLPPNYSSLSQTLILSSSIEYLDYNRVPTDSSKLLLTAVNGDITINI